MRRLPQRGLRTYFGRRAPLRPLRQHADQGSPECEADALLVHGLPGVLQCQDRHRHRSVEGSAPQVGHCDLPVPHQPQGCVEHEASPGYRRIAADRWFMLHRIREAWAGDEDGDPFDGPVEVDETYMGGKRRNMSNAKRKELAGTGRGAVGKTAVVGVKDRASNEVRAEVVAGTDAETLQDFVEENTEDDAKVYTDYARAYKGVELEHEAVRHSVSEYVRGQAHTNGIESFWAMLKRAHDGTFHKMSPKHLQRYVAEFAGKHNIRDSGTLAQMRATVARLVGRNLLYRDLIADNGLASGARS